ncbi:DoxX family protein [Actinomycetospora cinnamomea]|uniref:DoxX-like protein n=1 Tax=Actinomycetospora cinnamomea TaxID=663609 RepID=A0A2U1F6Z2_9PSEU|nr:DoxX family protein [Actinomycetospora cinnamomea]PVZ07946.1 DoxX-like protein [Actinomycetospora cinnamomea]
MTTIATPTATRSRARRYALVVLQVLLAAVYVASGIGKVGLDPTVVAGFAAMGIGPAGTVTIGVLELLGAIGLLIPRLAGLAATAFVALMIGAVVITAATVGVAMVPVPAVVLVLVAVVAWARRHETAALLRDPRRLWSTRRA